MTSGEFPIAVTDQASKKIKVIGPEGVLWDWSPEQPDGSPSPGWGLPLDVKLRHHDGCGGYYMLVTDSYRFAAIVPYPLGGAAKWFRIVKGNLHSAELLPDGNLALAASTGGWVRVYASSQGMQSDYYGEFALPDAHGVQWDPDRKVLWAVGDDRLVALSIEGAPDAPVLRTVHEARVPSRWGHDLSPVYGDPDLLWVTTNAAVYQYVKSSDSWTTDYPGTERANRASVKSIGNQPSGAIVQTKPSAGHLYKWGTDTIDFFLPDDKLRLPGSCLYKARVWRSEYQ